jgi:flagella basal body P-ring formation protein FlgA
MFLLTKRLILKAILSIASILIGAMSFCLVPFLLLYASHLYAESYIPDPLEGYVSVKTPEMIALPVPRNSIRKGSIITENDLIVKDFKKEAIPSEAVQDIAQIIGQQAKISLYKEKPISLKNIGSMTIVKRNDTVIMHFYKGLMVLQTTGRALEEGGAGDVIKVMNLNSKKIITGQITKSGDVDVAI